MIEDAAGRPLSSHLLIGSIFLWFYRGFADERVDVSGRVIDLRAANTQLKGVNPYTLPAGKELDAVVTELLYPGSEPLPFSTDTRLADKVKAQLKALYGFPIVEGKTRLPGRKYFARFESGPSTSTEVLAETREVAICRLAVLIQSNHKSRSPKG